MDCPHYLKQLDAVFPGSEDHDDPGVQEAVAHVSECKSCSQEFQARQEFDRRVATRMRDVAVPGEAKERLLQRINQADSPETMLAVPATASSAGVEASSATPSTGSGLSFSRLSKGSSGASKSRSRVII